MLSNNCLVLLLALFVSFSVAQTTCENYGVSSGSSCSCPPGFGGSTCSAPACGGNIFQGNQRNLISGATETSFGNLTASSCVCQDGWTGTGCNVCQSPTSCQSALTAANGTSSSVDGLDGFSGLNSTLTCNTEPQVRAAGEMSCSVINPTLQALYPLDSTLTILRTLNTSLTPSQGLTSFGSSGTIYAQLWYSGVEQFYCTASSCTQTSPSGNGTSTWSCHNLECTCRPNTAFCGGIPLSNLTSTIDGLDGDLTIGCGALDADNGTATCSFQQSVLIGLFGGQGLSLSGCTFGECVVQGVIDAAKGNTTSDGQSGGGGDTSLSSGVIAGLAVVGGLIVLVLFGLVIGIWNQRKVRKGGKVLNGTADRGRVAVAWQDLSYTVPGASGGLSSLLRRGKATDDKLVLDGVSGKVEPGQMMGILGPSGAGKTTLVEILSNKHKSGIIAGHVHYPSTSSSSHAPRIGFVPQQDILSSTLTVFESLLFAARLRLPEYISDGEKKQRVEDVIEQLGLGRVRDVRIGSTSGEGRGISGGEMRRVSIGLELVASPDVLILDEPTSGLDSVSASKVASVLRSVAHDPENPTVVIASIHQPSSQLYQTFDQILLLSQGHALYNGPGSFAPARHFIQQGIQYQEGYNVADYLLDIASDPDTSANPTSHSSSQGASPVPSTKERTGVETEKNKGHENEPGILYSDDDGVKPYGGQRSWKSLVSGQGYVTTFLTQFEVLAWREWKNLRRDKTLFIAHTVISSVLGVFVGGLYFKTGLTIAGFQSRVGCLFFLGALIAFSSLSALYNVVENRPLFLRERSSAYYSPTAWLFSRFIFDVVPLRIIPTILVSSITYWMAGLAPHAANFFKFLFILVLYTLAMTLFNFLLACLFRNGGLAILLSALSALYQMTYAGFFVHLTSIPPVLRWLQWLCPLKYTLEALSVNEVGAGLMIEDTLQGVPVDVSASLIMELLFGFGENNYYRDVLVLFAFIAGFAVVVVGVVWIKVRETR